MDHRFMLVTPIYFLSYESRISLVHFFRFNFISCYAFILKVREGSYHDSCTVFCLHFLHLLFFSFIQHLQLRNLLILKIYRGNMFRKLKLLVSLDSKEISFSPIRMKQNTFSSNQIQMKYIFVQSN